MCIARGSDVTWVDNAPRWTSNKSYSSRHEKPLIKLLIRMVSLTLKQYRLLLFLVVASLKLKVSPFANDTSYLKHRTKIT